MSVIITTNGNLLNTEIWRPNFTGMSFYDGFSYDYETIYRTQPNVRTCVDFLARNVAQLGLHVYKREEDDSRVRVRDHPLSKLLNLPLPPEYKVSRYRLIESLMGDLGVYFNAYWLKIKTNGQVTGLLRIPPYLVNVRGGLAPIEYEVSLVGETKYFKPEEIVHFRGYQPGNSIMGLSPLETLRRVLAEEQAAGAYREKFWQNAARIGGVIERPANAPEWSEAARSRFKSEFESLYSGEANSGKTAILEEGMQWKPTTFTAEESQYLEGRKLTREECARAYHIPLPLVGILDEATFASIKEQHKMLYMDTLGPWLAMIEQDIAVQLIPDFPDSDGLYVEFNIQEKLQGDFEEQTQSFQSAVGRPWITANEARARMNMPKIEGGDELVTPLNVITGGLASPRDTGSQNIGPKYVEIPEAKAENQELVVRLVDKEKEYTQKWLELLTKTFNRQRASILSALPKIVKSNSTIFDSDRWNAELADDMRELTYDNILEWLEFTAKKLGVELTQDNLDTVKLWAEKNSVISAEHINSTTQDSLLKVLNGANTDEEKKSAVRKLFDVIIGVRAYQIANSRVNILSNFGVFHGAELSGGRITKKTWMLGPGSNHRESHLKVAGETVDIKEKFSNGLLYPGDVRNARDASETANCGCYLKYSK